MLFENEYRFTKQMVADFFEIDLSTIDRYLEKYSDELKHNGYILSKGKRLNNFKLEFGHLIDKASKTTQLGLFNFRSFLNLAMLLVESPKARHLRSKILDIVIDTINNRTGGNTRYINQRDTDKIYECVFKEKAKEYKEILNLTDKENIRETMYAEVLDLIASFEAGLAFEIKKASNKEGRKLLPLEVDAIFNEFAAHPAQLPHLEKARIKMASRDLHFRDAFQAVEVQMV